MTRQAAARPGGDRPRGGRPASGRQPVRSMARRHRLLTTVAVLAALALAITAGGEFTARRLIRDKIAERVTALGNVQVSENGSLALWDILTKRIPRLDITGNDATIGPFTQVTVEATLDGVTLGATPSITSAHAVVTVPDSSVAAAVQAKAPRVGVSSVTSDPGAGTVTVAIGPGGIGRLALRPALAHGKVTFSAVSLTVMGRPVPLAALGSTGSSLGAAFGTRQTYPLGLAVSAVTVTSSGVRVTLNGGRSTLKGT